MARSGDERLLGQQLLAVATSTDHPLGGFNCRSAGYQRDYKSARKWAQKTGWSGQGRGSFEMVRGHRWQLLSVAAALVALAGCMGRTAAPAGSGSAAPAATGSQAGSQPATGRTEPITGRLGHNRAWGNP